MLVAFANNQTIVAIVGTPAVITTDPVPLGNNDRADVEFNVHSVFSQGTSAEIEYQAEVSNDGVNFVPVTDLTDSATAVTDPPKKLVKPVNGAYLRFVFTLTVQDQVGEVGGTCFDLNVKLDHI